MTRFALVLWIACVPFTKAESDTSHADDKETSMLAKVIHIVFPKDGYEYTLAAAAKGVVIKYKIDIDSDVDGVIPLPFGPSFAEPAGPSGLFPRERIAGNNQLYCLLDFGLSAPPREKAQRLKKGSYEHAFPWDGRNWTGPSDTNNPKGAPFPAGTYELSVTIHGQHLTAKGKVPYEITAKTKLTLK